MIGLVFLTLFQDTGTTEALANARMDLRAGKYAEVVVGLRDLASRLPNSAEVFDMLGTAEFMVGRPADSCKAFDRQIKLRPDDGPGHWRRGISLYYAGRYAEGQKQFEDYQSVDGNDVENTVWKLMCQVRAPGQSLVKAQKEMLPIGLDRRIPMMKVLDLFAGKAKIAEVEHISAIITQAVHEQDAATKEIARNVRSAATSAGSMSSHADQVANAMAQTGAGVEAMVSMAREIDQMARRMQAHTEELAKSLAS